MAQVGARPVPARRRDLPRVDTSTKSELVNSFVGFNTTTVTDEHIQLARRCNEQITLRSARFEHIPFHMILQWNIDKPNYLSMIAQACDLLLKYVVNLLKPKRPQVWRSIKTTNSHFCARVDCMVGARDILVAIGYSEKQNDSAMQFPDHVKEPNKEKLHVIAAELLMAKLEAESIQSKMSPHESSKSGVERSNSVQSSNPVTPTSELQSLSPRVSHISPQNSHLMPSASHARTANDEGLKTTMLYTDVTADTTPQGGGSVASQDAIPNVSSQSASSPHHSQPYPVRPTETFTPHPNTAGAYETAVPTKLRSNPQPPQPTSAPPVSNTPPASGHSSLASSPSSSSYATPPSDSPNTTGTVTSTSTNMSTSAANLKDELQKLRMVREKIANKLARRVATSDAVGSTHTPNHGNQPTQKSTALQGEAPTVEELMVSSNAMKKKAKPFNPGPVIEEEPSNGSSLETKPSSGPPSVSNSSPPKVQLHSGTPCANCGNIVMSEQTQCSYCSHPVAYRHPTSSILPPPMHTETSLMRMDSDEPRSKPLRASVAGVQEAMQRHRMTHVLPPNGHDPSGGMAPGDRAVGGGRGGGGAVGGSGIGERGGASGGTSGSEAGADERSYRDITEEKLEMWKAEWRKRGYGDDEIPKVPGSQDLPEYRPPDKRRVAKSASVKKLKSSDYNRSKNTTSELERYQKEEERKKEMERMAKEGEELMKCVKLCVQYSYSLEEVELAYKKCRGEDKQKEVLKYLRQDWAASVREVQQYVLGLVDQNGRRVGCPSPLEARKYLVLARGDVMVASHKLYYHRKKKIEELQLKCKPYCELEWGIAEQALSAFDMNLEKAACSVQCETLQPLYEFIFSEWTQVPATDMKDIKQRLKNGKDESGKEANLRMLMGEFRLETTDKAVMVLELMNKVEVDDDSDYPLSYYIDAAKDYSSLEEAERGLIKECPICGLELPVHETITMPGCTDTMCKDCFKGHFRVVITEKGVKHFNCPTCDQPDMTNRDDAQDLYQELFVHMIHEHLPEQYDLVQAKLTERNLQKDPGFRWCVNDTCASCFINPNLERKKIQCPACNGLMCFQCKKPWEDQHNGLSCEDFAEWKRRNDPKFQKEGLAAHLQANGIECPDCHMRYELARGGCMHFKCTRCPNEFCSGCGGSFKKAQLCGRFQSCATRGLHAHHPRDCLYFMRDFSVEELQAFLKENNVDFETEAAREEVEEEQEAVEGEEEAAANEEDKEVVLKCSAMLQKELVDKLVDEACGDEVKDGHAGLCEKHYKEYLVDRINKAKLDPLPMYDNIDIILKREEKPVPEKEDEETDEHYRQRLIEHVKQELPLQRGKPDVAAARAENRPEDPLPVVDREN